MMCRNAFSGYIVSITRTLWKTNDDIEKVDSSTQLLLFREKGRIALLFLLGIYFLKTPGIGLIVPLIQGHCFI